KSVCLNSIIVSLMYQNTPDELRFIMVDPKRVELPVYNNIPYLLTPVITEVPKTINALKWCLNEMDRRFELLQKTGVRNIQGYNETADVKMPYVIFVIDELADLMVAAAKDIEAGVIRLAQMARAVGIHLILATQRPSVDVITGLIKANMPGRIAFSVASGTDSRTILDMLGAEKLLGRGDMLYINAELSKPVRLQGAFLSDSEIKRVVRFIKTKSKQSAYLDNVTERQTVKGIGGIGLDGVKGDEDELLHEAKEIVLKYNKASASLLQRRLRIGYARAASILDQLEELGFVGPANGSKPREILISPAEAEALDQQGTSGVSIHSRADSKPHESYLGEDEPETPPVFEDDPSTSLGAGEDEENEDMDNDDEESDEDDSEDEESDDDNEEEESDDEEELNDEERGGDEESEDEEDDEEDEDEEDEEDENNNELEDKLFSR
ncbi:DNA translocase FtsK, partial [Candidatus Parcubacteria bacterium]|nr:DNA translocase FtsK [Candidatus Parcubacteria bacterium]